MHYPIIIGVIAVIVIWQIATFISTKRKLKNFRNIFSSEEDAYKLSKEEMLSKINSANNEELDKMLHAANLDAQKYHYTRYTTANGDIPCFKRQKAINDLSLFNDNNNCQGIFAQHNNPIFTEIITSINNYLQSNKSGVGDFHLMKDIVDRNCDAKEEEIDTQIPIPLYLGLVGTMAGILVGIGYLWISGGLNDLLSADSGNSGTDGVEALLGGVALAMISSILGILLTTFGSMKAKTSKAKTEHNKHIFLSWMQVKLLPTLSNDTAQTLEKMSQNLVAFNNTFAENTGSLGTALAKVNESYKLQTELIATVNKIQESRTSVANLQLLAKLIESSKQIGILAKYLENTNEYLANVKALNEKLDAGEQRTKAIEEMAVFFKNEISQVEQRKETISKAVGTIDSILEERLRKLTEHAGENVENFNKALGKQQDALQKKLDETQIIVSELKNLSAIKESISKFESAMRVQNGKLDTLATAIQALAKAKAESGDIPISLKPKIAIETKILIWIGSVVVGILLLALLIANWDAIYYGIIYIFRF
jgi:type II secretory pathway pseudopilin PulG